MRSDFLKEAEANQLGVCRVNNDNLKHVITKKIIMERYANLRGNSPITYYEIEPRRIIVWFGSKSYSYSYASAGRSNVEMMKELAMDGSGLSAFITRNARFDYDK